MCFKWKKIFNEDILKTKISSVNKLIWIYLIIKIKTKIFTLIIYKNNKKYLIKIELINFKFKNNKIHNDLSQIVRGKFQV